MSFLFCTPPQTEPRLYIVQIPLVSHLKFQISVLCSFANLRYWAKSYVSYCIHLVQPKRIAYQMKNVVKTRYAQKKLEYASVLRDSLEMEFSVKVVDACLVITNNFSLSVYFY